jgi:hypothetical protein
MSIAEKTKQFIGKHGLVAFSLSMGNGITPNGQEVNFGAAKETIRKNNKDGRCISSTASYSDGSKLVYKFCTRTDTFTLAVA